MRLVSGNNRSGEALGLVWVDCSYPLITLSLAQVLGKEARVHVGPEPLPREEEEESPSFVIIGPDEVQGLSEVVQRAKEANPRAAVLVFGMHLDLSQAWAALRAGARGYIHAGMQPAQVLRALKVAQQGEIVAPRELLAFLLAEENAVDLNVLSARKREVLGFVGEGMSNAQIAKRLFLTESTVKQHLRAAYKVLGVKNRTEAAGLMRNGA